MKGFLVIPLLLLLTLLSGCGVGGGFGCMAPGNPHCGGDGWYARGIPFIGTWLNEDPQPAQVTRIEVYKKTKEGDDRLFIYARIWERCGDSDCAFEEWEPYTSSTPEDANRVSLYIKGGSNVYGEPAADEDRYVSVKLTLLSDHRAQAEVTFYAASPDEDVSLGTNIYFFYRAP